MRPPGSSLRRTRRTRRAALEVLEVRGRNVALPSSSSYSLPAKYGGDVTTSATELFDANLCVMDAEFPTIDLVDLLVRADIDLVFEHDRRVKRVVERARIMGLASANHAEVGCCCDFRRSAHRRSYDRFAIRFSHYLHTGIRRYSARSPGQVGPCVGVGGTRSCRRPRRRAPPGRRSRHRRSRTRAPAVTRRHGPPATTAWSRTARRRVTRPLAPDLAGVGRSPDVSPFPPLPRGRPPAVGRIGSTADAGPGPCPCPSPHRCAGVVPSRWPLGAGRRWSRRAAVDRRGGLRGRRRVGGRWRGSHDRAVRGERRPWPPPYFHPPRHRRARSCCSRPTRLRPTTGDPPTAR